MKLRYINKMWTEDDELFEMMKGHYQSDNEREFFEKMLYKQQWECTIAHDLLLSEKDNDDDIYIIRIDCSEYVVGNVTNPADEVHVMNLSDALNLNLKAIRVLDEDITLFEWLRRRDYAGIDYNNDFDYE